MNNPNRPEHQKNQPQFELLTPVFILSKNNQKGIITAMSVTSPYTPANSDVSYLYYIGLMEEEFSGWYREEEIGKLKGLTGDFF